MKGKICVVTGGSTGIGKATAVVLARAGATVVLVSRDEGRGRGAVADVMAASGSESVRWLQADLSSQGAVRRLARVLHDLYERIDVLVNNAGVIVHERQLTVDGLERQFAVNYLAGFLLTNLVLDLVVASPAGRIINVASQIQAQQIDFGNLQGEKQYSGFAAYGLSKVGNVMFTHTLAKRLADTSVTVNSLHPGVIDTGLLAEFNTAWSGTRPQAQPKRRGLLKSVRRAVSGGSGTGGAPTEVGGQAVAYLAMSDEVVEVSGQYFKDNRVSPPSPIAFDEELTEQLWAVSVELTQLDENILSDGLDTEEDDMAEDEILAFPASSAQQRLWFVDQLDPGKPVYNIPYHHQMRWFGPLDVEALERALAEIVARHDPLRTTFMSLDGTPVQVIDEETDFALDVIDLQGLGRDEQEAQVREYVDAAAMFRFDLQEGPLFFAQLLQLAEEEHVFICMNHHIVVDGVSLEFFAAELWKLYEAFSIGRPSPLEPLPIQYPDFVMWHEEWMESKAIQQQVDFWKEKLGDNPAVLELPTDFARPKVQLNNGAWKWIHIAPELVSRLQVASRESGVSLFMTLLAGFKVLLSRYSGQADISVGSPTANRNQPELEQLIAYFVNPVVMRTDLSGDPTFSDLVQRVRKNALGAFANQDVPFERLVEELKPPRDLSYNPLFQVSFTLQMEPMIIELPGVQAEPIEFDNNTAKFDLLVELWEKDGGVSGRFEYCTDLFRPETIERMMGHYETILAGVVARPDAPISELPILTEAERGDLLGAWNDTGVEVPAGACVHHLFEQRAASQPNKVAVVFRDQQLTYGELNEKANQLAHHLISLGVSSEQFVGLCVDRSLDTMIGLMGIHKAGAAYLPLDPEYPEDRLLYMLSDTKASVLLSQTRVMATHQPLGEGRQVILLDEDWGAIGTQPQTNPNVAVAPENLAYVIHTSGSTGLPKGVLIPHGNVVNFLQSMASSPGLTADDTLMAVTTLSFDIAVLELFLPMSVGATLVVVARDTAWDGKRLAERMVETGATVMQATPATWQLLLNQGWQPSTGLRMLCGGEALPRKLADELIGNGGELWNMYGPTETTIWSSIWRVEPTSGVLIGRPIGNTQMYVLDGSLGLVPAGVTGELYIGGSGVARGYLNRPDLTEERFLDNPYGEGRIYRTGDLARFRPDGQLECLGRVDFQVKVRGFRIELGEIESVLANHPTISQAVVAAKGDGMGDKRLLAYMIPEAGQVVPSVGELRTFMAQKLPLYMLPAGFMELESFPLTPNGKVDRRNLPEMGQSRPGLGTEYAPPTTEVEKALADIWADILDIERVGLNDNFFELGGHSLLATQVVARVYDDLDVDLPLPAMFESPVISELAQQVELARWATEGGGDVFEADDDWEEFEL